MLFLVLFHALPALATCNANSIAHVRLLFYSPPDISRACQRCTTVGGPECFVSLVNEGLVPNQTADKIQLQPEIYATLLCFNPNTRAGSHQLAANGTISSMSNCYGSRLAFENAYCAADSKAANASVCEMRHNFSTELYPFCRWCANRLPDAACVSTTQDCALEQDEPPFDQPLLDGGNKEVVYGPFTTFISTAVASSQTAMLKTNAGGAGAVAVLVVVCALAPLFVG